MAVAGGKVCDRCGKPYKGFGTSCSSCRKAAKGQDGGVAHDCERCGNFFVGFGELCADCKAGRGPGRMGRVLPTPEEVDAVLERIDTCLKKVDASQDSMVRLRKAEIDLLGNFEACRELMQRILKSGDRLLLKRTFIDCGRVAKLRAFLDLTALSEMNAKDQRFHNCQTVCASIEEMVGNDLGLSVELGEAEQGASSQLLMSRISVAMDPSKVSEFKVQVEPEDARKYGQGQAYYDDESDGLSEDDWEDDDDSTEEEKLEIFRENAKRLFDELDKARSGMLAKDVAKNAAVGLSGVLKACRIYKRKHVVALFQESLRVGDGADMLIFEDFLSLIVKAQAKAHYAVRPQLEERTVKQVFDTVDRDGDGTITCEELKFAYAGMLLRSGEKVDAKRVEKWAARNFKKYDTDLSQALDIKEFRDLLENCGGLNPMIETMQR